MTTKKAAKKAATKKRASSKPATKAERLTPGSTLTRTIKGTKHVVQVTAKGFAYKGTEYSSLTALAKKFTGYAAVSGPRFFGTDEKSTTKAGA